MATIVQIDQAARTPVAPQPTRDDTHLLSGVADPDSEDELLRRRHAAQMVARIANRHNCPKQSCRDDRHAPDIAYRDAIWDVLGLTGVPPLPYTSEPPKKPDWSTPMTTTSPAPAPDLPTAASVDPDSLIHLGEQSPSAPIRKLAAKCRTGLDELRCRLADEEATRQLKAEIADLEERLRCAKQKLRSTSGAAPASDQAPRTASTRRYQPGIDYKPAQVRAFAREHGLHFPAKGPYLPDDLVERYLQEEGAA